MNAPEKDRVLARAEAALASHPPLAEAIELAGRVARVTCGDDEEGAILIDRAEALVTALFDAIAAGRFGGAPPSVEAAALDGWLADPRRSHGAALDAIDRAGAIAAGLAATLPDSEDAARAAHAVADMAERIRTAAGAHGAEMFEAALAACGRIADRGAEPGSDLPLLALSDVVAGRLAAALSGEPLEAPSPARAEPIDAGLAERLGAALARALDRRDPLRVADELLAFALPSVDVSRELVLHRAAERREHRPFEVLGGVRVALSGRELEVELPNRADAQVLLVPILHGEPDRPCPRRTGAHERQLLFALPDDAADVDGFALVVGDRLAFVTTR